LRQKKYKTNKKALFGFDRKAITLYSSTWLKATFDRNQSNLRTLFMFAMHWNWYDSYLMFGNKHTQIRGLKHLHYGQNM